MKICFVLEYYPPHMGGAEYLFQNLAERLAARGHEVVVVTQRLPGTAEEESVGGVRIRRVRSGNRYLFALVALPAVLSAARGADVVHTTTFNSAFPAWLAARILGKPVVLTVLEVWLRQWHAYTDLAWPRAAFHNIMERLLYALPFDRYAAISRSTHRQLLAAGVHADRVRTVYCGFDGSPFAPERHDGSIARERHGLEGRYLIFSWGRPGPSKGHEYLIYAVPRILRDIPDAKVLLMLSATDTYAVRTRYLTRLIRDLGVGSAVEIVPPAPRSELGSYLKAADCVVIPSLAEGFGYAVLEAVTMRRPVVATNTTSIPEVIGGTYVLVEPKSAEAIAEGVIRISRGEANTGPVPAFPWDGTAQAYEVIYRDLTGAAEGSGGRRR